MTPMARIMVTTIEFFGLCHCGKHAEKEVTSIHCSVLGHTKMSKKYLKCFQARL